MGENENVKFVMSGPMQFKMSEHTQSRMIDKDGNVVLEWDLNNSRMTEMLEDTTEMLEESEVIDSNSRKEYFSNFFDECNIGFEFEPKWKEYKGVKRLVEKWKWNRVIRKIMGGKIRGRMELKNER